MQFKRLRKTFRKQLEAQQKQVEFLSEATEKSIERNVFKRFSRLFRVRRFIIGWVSLMLLLIGALVAQFTQLSAYYQTTQPVAGGIYTEGIVGSISNVNPIYATSDADRSLSRLLFSGLLGYDSNGKLVPRLAKDYQASENGRTYTVTLKDGMRWHDGKPVTAKDVAYTFNTIKNPDARSPLFSTWQNITVTATDQNTVTFTLPTSLASFPYSLTTGLIPSHLLASVAAGSLRSNQFNTVKPVGTGPFSWRDLQVSGDGAEDLEQQASLVPFENYVEGEPKLSQFILRVFSNQARLEQAFTAGQLTAAAGLNDVPANSSDNSQSVSMLLSAGTYAFFKTTNSVLNSSKVRQALVAASNPTAIIGELDYVTRPVVSPLLTGQLAFDKRYVQSTNNLEAAKQLLTSDGWQSDMNGKISKAGEKLTFSLVIADTPENKRVADALKKQWELTGATVNVRSLQVADYASALAAHDYDVTLNGISIGADPDVYAYWHSTQADIRATNRLNLSEWKNTTADQALEAGRTRSDGQLRAIKYVPFLQAWQQEAPALGLYQPRYVYVTRGEVYGLTTQTITSPTDRYIGIEDWQIRTARVTM